MIFRYGRKKFGDYVRGIYFRKKRTVYLRDHTNKKWLNDTKRMLRKCGAPKTTRIIYGSKAARSLRLELEGL